MANPTGFISSKSPYSNNDLNTIFAPISNVDYGGFTFDLDAPTSPSPIGETWATFRRIQYFGGAGNVSTNGTNFIITNEGIYKLQMSLIFGGDGATYQPMVFILNSVSSIPLSNGYDFLPRPALEDIYSISGLSVAGNGTVTNYNNTEGIANQLQTNTSGSNYMFAFTLVGLNTNIATFEITFNVSSANQYNIFPQIRCRQQSTDPTAALNSGNWLFTKLN